MDPVYADFTNIKENGHEEHPDSEHLYVDHTK